MKSNSGQFKKGFTPWNKNKHYKSIPCSDSKKLAISISNFHHPRKREDEINLSPYFMELVGNIK